MALCFVYSNYVKNDFTKDLLFLFTAPVHPIGQSSDTDRFSTGMSGPDFIDR